MLQLKCLNCGNPDLQVKDSIGICPSCGSRFILEAHELKAFDPMHDSDSISSDEEYEDPEFVREACGDSLSVRRYCHVPIVDANPDEFVSDESIFFEKESEDRTSDKNAIHVLNASPGTGYVKPGFIRKQIREWLEQGWEYEADTDTVGLEGVSFSITLYKPFDTFRSMRADLKGLDKQTGYFTRRENLKYLIKGTLLEAEYDADNDVYVLFTEIGSEVGELPSSVSEKITDLEEFYVIYDEGTHVRILY